MQLKLGGSDDSKEFTSFLIELMRGKEVFVPDGPRGKIGARIMSMFRDAQKVGCISRIFLRTFTRENNSNNVNKRVDVFLQAAHMMTSVGTSHEVETSGDGKYKSFPEPSSKEFILRAITPRPSVASTTQPQRMYASLRRDSIRLAGSFSEDTVFL